MSTDPAADRASLNALQRGDAASLNRIIARWQRPLLGFAYRYVQDSADSQDLVAETFVRLYQNRARLRGDTNLAAWLFTTLTNLCHNHHRWKRRHPTVALESPAEPGDAGGPPRAVAGMASPEAAPDAALAQDEALEAVRAAVDALPHDLKVAVLLHHYERLSYREIAAVARCSERGVETRLYRARQLLRRQLSAFLREATPC
ncbi:MAG TPA: sigma-70 family RNA polymerase sigma factor [Opitutaceae bacterium]|nr:sigma-70 family RNA polymerase sigma factor [Opitutaceae bacterium]